MGGNGSFKTRILVILESLTYWLKILPQLSVPDIFRILLSYYLDEYNNLNVEYILLNIYF